MISENIELSINSGYVSHWGVWEGARELIQNAIDRGDFTVKEDLDKGSLTITSFGETLEKKALMLGHSSKRQDESKIGKYGEGLKLALLVLIREGKTVTIFNGSDTWKPQISYSHVFEDEVLSIGINKDTQAFENSVKIVIEGLSEKDLNLIDDNYIQDDTYLDKAFEYNNSYAFIKDYDELYYAGNKDSPQAHPSKIYISGLFVCEIDAGFMYNYNMSPKDLKLDRDRNAVSSFDLAWYTGEMLTASGEIALLAQLATDNCTEAKYYSDNYSASSSLSQLDKSSLAKQAVANFYEKYGDNAHPVDESWEVPKTRLITHKIFAMGKTPVTVTKAFYSMFNKEMDLDDKLLKTLKDNPDDLLKEVLEFNSKNIKRITKEKIETYLNEKAIMLGKV